MKNKIIVLLISFLSIFLVACSYPNEEYNLVITNNSGDSIKIIGVCGENSSTEIINANETPIKNHDNVNVMVDSNKFRVNVTDNNNKVYKSKEFNIDFSSNKDKIYNISIEKNRSNDFQFILK